MSTITLPDAPEAAIRTFLTFMRDHGQTLPADRYAYRNPADFVLREGRYYPARPLPKGYRAMPLKGCFSNAAALALTRPGLRYCEGTALGRVLPVDHAWCLDEDGAVVDPTWRVGRDGWEQAATGYLGVVIPTPMIRLMVLDRHDQFCAIGRWWDSYPLLREPWKEG